MTHEALHLTPVITTFKKVVQQVWGGESAMLNAFSGMY